MNLIYLIIPLLMTILCWAYMSMQRDIISPSVMFTGPFVLACFFACIYKEKWDLNLHFNTFIVLLFGCFEFVLSCNIVHLVVGNKIRKRAIKQIVFNRTIGVINPKLWKILFIIMVQCLSLYVVIKDMSDLLGAIGINGNLSTLMYYYREYHMFNDEYNVVISSLASNLRLFSIAVSYIWIYIIVNNWICKKNKKVFFMLLSIALGIGNGIILGARGEALQIIVAFVVMYFFLRKKYNGWKPNIKLGQLIFLGCFALMFAYGFKFFGILLGRETITSYGISAVDEIAKYIGAEIKNLDIYLETPHKFVSNSIPGSQTFGNIIEWCAWKLNMNLNITRVLPFQKINGVSLGNVYTIFYAYIYDFGYVGLIILNFIMAVVSQLVYEYAILERKKDVINIKIIIVSYILFLIVFSFFGERFFSYILNISFIKYLLIWKIMVWFVAKLKFRF